MTRPYKNPQINLRIPQDLKEKTQIIAEMTGRSMNGEIIEAIQSHVDKYSVDPHITNQFERLEVDSLPIEELEKIKKEGALEVMRFIEESTRRHRDKLINYFLKISDEILDENNKKTEERLK